MNCQFVVGQKVVCIADLSGFHGEVWAIAYNIEFPKQGRIYTIRAIDLMPDGSGVDVPGLLLEEVVNATIPTHPKGGIVPRCETFLSEIHWFPDDFRPLVARKTDISVFTEILKTTRIEERA